MELNYDFNMFMMGLYIYVLKKRVMLSIGYLFNEDVVNFCVEFINEGIEFILLVYLSKENNFFELVYEILKGVLVLNDIVVG